MTKAQRERKLVVQALLVTALLLGLLNWFAHWLTAELLPFWVNVVLGAVFLLVGYQTGVKELATRRQAGLED